MTPAAMA